MGEPGAQGGDGGGRQEAAAAGGLGQFGDGEARYVAESGLGEQGPVLAGDLGDHLVGHSVEDGDEGRVVLLGAAQQAPGHGVGVAGGGGDHDPDVGGADEPGGEHAVVGDEGVDVGRVEEGEPAGQVAGGLDAQDVFVVVGGGEGPELCVVGPPWRPYAGEVGQDSGPGEPAVVLRVADEYGGAGRGPQHPGLADLPPDEGIDEGRLPGTGRPADHGEQGASGSRSRGTR